MSRVAWQLALLCWRFRLDRLGDHFEDVAWCGKPWLDRHLLPFSEPDKARQSPDAGGSASARPARFGGGEMASDARSRVASGEVHQSRPGSESGPRTQLRSLGDGGR